MDRYVSGTIGDNGNDGLTVTTPFATLTYALPYLDTGDTLYVMTGTYTDVPSKIDSTTHNSGTSTDKITVVNYLNETPIITISNTIALVNLSWWVWDGLTFQNSKGFVLGQRNNTFPIAEQCRGYASDIVIQNCTFQHGSERAIDFQCAYDITVQDNLFDNLRSRIDGMDLHAINMAFSADDVLITRNVFSDIGADGIQFGLVPNDSLEGFQNITVSHNEFKVIRPYTYRDTNGDVVDEGTRPFDNVGENGLDFKDGPGPIIVEHNTFHGFRPVLEVQDASGANGIGLGMIYDANGITVSKNHFYDNTSHISIGLIATTLTSGNDIVIRNNVLEDAVYHDTHNSRSLRAAHTPLFINVEFYNNTITQKTDNRIEVLVLENILNVSVKNNVFKNGVVTRVAGGNFDLDADYNEWSEINGTVDTDLTGPNDRTDDNIALDPVTWTPNSSSPLRNNGTDVGLVDDYYNSPIIQNPDIGAAEYQVGLYLTENGLVDVDFIGIRLTSSGLVEGSAVLTKPIAVNDGPYTVTSGTQFSLAAPGILTNDIYVP